MSDDLYEKQAALQTPQTLATVVHRIILQQYGEISYDWDPATIALELRDDFKADLADAVVDRWCAIQLVMVSDAFFQRMDAFTTVCNTLADGVPFFQVFDPVTVEEAGWALTEVQLNREMLELSPTIKNYLRLLLKQDGYQAEADYPHIFKDVLLGEQPQSTNPPSENAINVEAYIDDQLKDMAYQFEKIPSLKGMQEIILARSMEEFVSK